MQPRAKNKRLASIVMGGLIIFLMVFSVLGLWSEQSGQETYKYKSIKFTNTDYGWVGYKDNQKITLLTNPKELEDITIGYVPIYMLNQLQKVYISMDYNENVARAEQEFEQNIRITTKTFPACVKDSPVCADLPLKDCKDATAEIGVIVFKESNQTEASLINNCLTIQGPEPIKIVDKVILTQL